MPFHIPFFHITTSTLKIAPIGTHIEIVLKLFLFNDIFKDKLEKVDNEKRKHSRAKCLIPAELVDSEGRSVITGRVNVKDFSHEGLKLNINFEKLKPGSAVDIKIYLPEKKIITLLSGEITWNKYANNKMEMGLKIKKMDKDVKEEILSWIFPQWISIDVPSKKKKIKKKK